MLDPKLLLMSLNLLHPLNYVFLLRDNLFFYFSLFFKPAILSHSSVILANASYWRKKTYQGQICSMVWLEVLPTRYGFQMWLYDKEEGKCMVAIFLQEWLGGEQHPPAFLPTCIHVCDLNFPQDANILNWESNSHTVCGSVKDSTAFLSELALTMSGRSEDTEGKMDVNSNFPFLIHFFSSTFQRPPKPSSALPLNLKFLENTLFASQW